MSSPIGDYALLSDCQGAALVGRDGWIYWACLPRFDSPALFARLLDPCAGPWRIAPVEPAEAERGYLAETMVLRTECRTALGTVAVTDVMAFGPDERGHRIGRGSPHVIVRRLEGVKGTVDVKVELSPRAGYGLTEPVLVGEKGGIRTRGGPFAYVISTEAPLSIERSDATATIRVGAGDVLHFALQVTSPWGEQPALLTGAEMAVMLDATIDGWQSWSGLHQNYHGPYAAMVRHIGRLRQALTYARSGARVAVPTTALPETLGGSRH